MPPALAHPDLYRLRDDGHVALLGIRCTGCGHVAFPRQSYGCEKCGSTALAEIDLATAGTLASFATVHLHQSKSIAAPFVIGEIDLDDGPTLRITLAEQDDAALAIGARMTGTLVPAGPGDAASPARLELRFTVESPR